MLMPSDVKSKISRKTEKRKMYGGGVVRYPGSPRSLRPLFHLQSDESGCSSERVHPKADLARRKQHDSVSSILKCEE